MTAVLSLLVICAASLALFSLRSLAARTGRVRLLNRSRSLLDSGDKAAAVRTLVRILATDRGNPDASWLLARAYAESGQLMHAEMTLRDILYANRFSKETDEESVRLLLADIYEQRGEFRKAAGEYFILRNAALLAVPAAIRAGRMSLDHNRLREAELFLQDAARKERKNPEVRFLLGRLEFQRMNLPQAIEHLHAALAGGWKIPETRLFLARALLLRRDFKAALEQLQSLPPDTLASSGIEEMLGRCFAYLQDNTEAAGLMEKLLPELEAVSSPLVKDALFLLGSARESDGRAEDALRLWKESASRFDHVASKEKIAFYEGPGRSPALRRFLTCPAREFFTLSTRLVEELGFLAEELPAADNSRSLDFLCRNSRDLHPHHRTLVHISRKTTPLTAEDILSLIRIRDTRRVRELLIVSPLFDSGGGPATQRKGVATLPLADLFTARATDESQTSP